MNSAFPKSKPYIVTCQKLTSPPMLRDCFQTPDHALDPLAPFLKRGWQIWDPASGKGNLVRGLRKRGFRAFGTDILTGRDFFHTLAECDAIITNPPYSLKDAFLERCAVLGKPFALLMPLTALEGQRQELLRCLGIEIILSTRRFNFETPTGMGHGAWFATAWFCSSLQVAEPRLPKGYHLLSFPKGTKT
jgi:hypothetical protein